VETGGPQEQRVGLHDGHVGHRMTERLPQVARRRAADEKDVPRGRVSQERRVDDLLGGRPLRLKHQEAVLVKDTLAIPGLDDDATVGGIGGEGQVRPLPAEGGAVNKRSKRQEDKKQEDKRQERKGQVGKSQVCKLQVCKGKSGGQINDQDECGDLEGVQVADEDETEERAACGGPGALPEVGFSGGATRFGQTPGQGWEEGPRQQADRRDGEENDPRHRPELHQGTGRNAQQPPRGAHQEHLEGRQQAESDQSSRQNLVTTRNETARQPGAQRPPGQPGGQDQAQDQFVAVEDGDQFPHQQDLGNGSGKTKSQKGDPHELGERERYQSSSEIRAQRQDYARDQGKVRARPRPSAFIRVLFPMKSTGLTAALPVTSRNIQALTEVALPGPAADGRPSPTSPHPRRLRRRGRGEGRPTTGTKCPGRTISIG
jgi:hypothetical protein